MNNVIVKDPSFGTLTLALGLLAFSCSDNTTTTNPVGTQNNPPVLASIENKDIYENATLTIWLTVTGPDGDSLILQVTFSSGHRQMFRPNHSM